MSGLSEHDSGQSEGRARRGDLRGRLHAPTNLANWNANEYYSTEEAYCIAIADALHEEYQAIADAGLVLQIDDPQLASHWAMHPELDLAECRKWASASVELLNHALRDIPADPLSHLLQHQYGPAGPRHGIQAYRRHHARGAGWRLFVRSRQPAPRA
jgi:hypothetical protein